MNMIVATFQPYYYITYITSLRRSLIYSRKSESSRMESWGSLALTRYSCEDFHPDPLNAIYYLEKMEKRRNKAKHLTWNFVRLKFVKKISMPNPVKSLGYIKCYSLSSPRPIKSPSNSIRYNCHKTCSWSKRPKTILEIRKKATLL